jgi:hypothetical protein
MTEDEAFVLHRQCSRLSLIVEQAERDYEALMRVGWINEKVGFMETRRLPVFLDLAADLAQEILEIARKAKEETADAA